ncbi:MAG: tRNA uridine-5-carboxymethylaminomethyl(34) synthesis GTPase MnmE [Syntrophomonas sp.]
MYNDDIAAIATPPGEGGIAIVRLSGSGVIDKVSSLFKPFNPDSDLKARGSHSLTLGWIMDEQQEALDEVLLGIMKGPHSYTGENVVEINCHGGTLPARRCLEAMLKSGVRLAEPGEFTRRAFLNGRLDASQAEAVIDVIRAKSEKGLKLAMKQLAGNNSRFVQLLEDKLIAVNAMLDASLDFPDEVGEPHYHEISQILQGIVKDIDKLLAAGRRGEIYRQGISIAICGKPNVGKSSLLNALLRKDKAIVTSIPGTTRDIIEDYLNVKGIPVRLMDTAGIRETQDIVERIGVERSQEVIKESDLIIFLLDVESGITGEDLEIFSSLERHKVLVLVNKEDLEQRNIDEQELKKIFAGVQVIRGSVKEEIGLEELEDSIEERVLSGCLASDDLELMITLRQKDALLRAKRHIEDTRDALQKVSLDCLSVDVWGALDCLGEITGKNLKEEVMERIFRDFCIGK